MVSFTLVEMDRAREVPAAVSDGRVRIPAEAVRDALGWALEPNGLCRGDVCVPVESTASLVSDDGLDLDTLADLLGRPLALDVEEGVAALGTAVADRTAALDTLEAPDFALPDLAGRLHSLSDHRGKKVLLVAYASW